jgi:probable phosphoglycerate mutase
MYVVPHAEATHHVDGLVGGWFDSELTRRGREQARRVAETLKGRIDAPIHVHSSDLRRALQTAEPIAAAFATNVEVTPDLRELSCGIAEGQLRAVFDARMVPPPLHGSRLDHRLCEGAETRREGATRAARFVESLLLANPSVPAVVVTHGGMLTYLFAAWLGMPIHSVGRVKFWTSAGSITTLEVDSRGDRVIVRFSDTTHLSDA